MSIIIINGKNERLRLTFLFSIKISIGNNEIALIKLTANIPVETYKIICLKIFKSGEANNKNIQLTTNATEKKVIKFKPNSLNMYFVLFLRLDSVVSISI